MGQRLPRGERQHKRVGHIGSERGRELVSASPGRGDRQQCRRDTSSSAPFEQRRDRGGHKSFDERKVSVSARKSERFVKRGVLLEGARNPSDCHLMSLRAASDIWSACDAHLG